MVLAVDIPDEMPEEDREWFREAACHRVINRILILELQTPRLRAHLPVAGVRDGVVVGLGLVLAEDVAGDLEAVGGALSAQVALPRSSHYIRLDEDNVRNVCTIVVLFFCKL